MFIAMNRFKVIKEESKAFEDLWVMRESHLGEVKGFQAFHLLRGPEREDHVLYSSHTIWASQEDFTAWTKIRTIPRRPSTRGRAQAAHTWPPGIRRVRSHPDDRNHASARIVDVLHFDLLQVH
jgi:heme-degrading monooxygenase HmoA